MNLPLFDPDSRRPDPLPQVRGPLIGWAGTLWSDLDLYPLLYAARERPDWTFLLLGRREKGNPLLPRLKKLPNVIVPGPCPVSEGARLAVPVRRAGGAAPGGAAL